MLGQLQCYNGNRKQNLQPTNLLIFSLNPFIGLPIKLQFPRLQRDVFKMLALSTQ